MSISSYKNKARSVKPVSGMSVNGKLIGTAPALKQHQPPPEATIPVVASIADLSTWPLLIPSIFLTSPPSVPEAQRT